MAAITTPPELDLAIHVPANVWENIFQRVGVLQLLEFRLICRSWRGIVDGSPALMNRICIKFPPGFALDRDYEPDYLVPARNLTLEKVRISAVNTWWPTFAQRLVFVSINDCTVSCSTLLQLLQPMTNLRVLQLGKLQMWKSSKVAVNFQMKQVETFSAEGLSEDIFSFLAPIFTQLRRIG
uniref:(northern house mosquito) hypothetical protein n=1 Tax=Culex pipiens TaxID=7175 RepID=A0A8D8L1W0_CULPI